MQRDFVLKTDDGAVRSGNVLFNLSIPK